MRLAPDRRVLVVSLNGPTRVGLARAAVRHGWPVIEAATALQAAREIRIARPEVIVVQVSRPSNEDLELIYLLHGGGRKVAVIAVATGHHEEIERAVRAVGANVYLPDADNADQIDDAVTQMFRPNLARAAPLARAPAG